MPPAAVPAAFSPASAAVAPSGWLGLTSRLPPAPPAEGIVWTTGGRRPPHPCLAPNYPHDPVHSVPFSVYPGADGLCYTRNEATASGQRRRPRAISQEVSGGVSGRGGPGGS